MNWLKKPKSKINIFVLPNCFCFHVVLFTGKYLLTSVVFTGTYSCVTPVRDWLKGCFSLPWGGWLMSLSPAGLGFWLGVPSMSCQQTNLLTMSSNGLCPSGCEARVISEDRNWSPFFRWRRRSSAWLMEDGLAKQSGEVGSAVSMSALPPRNWENIFEQRIPQSV